MILINDNMNISRLKSLNTVKSFISTCIPSHAANVSLQLRRYARKPSHDPDDEPIKFSTSGAVHGIADIRRIQLDNKPWYQGPIVTASFAVFLIYFCMLREENDIDLELDRSLYDRVEGLEIPNLKVARNYYLERGDLSEVSKIDARLIELGVPVSN